MKKKVITTGMYAVLLFAMIFCLAGCGESAKKQEAKETFNKTSDEFNEVADLINGNLDAIDEDIVTLFQGMSDALEECRVTLENSDASDEDYENIIKTLEEGRDWLKEAKTEVKAEIANAD